MTESLGVCRSCFEPVSKHSKYVTVENNFFHDYCVDDAAHAKRILDKTKVPKKNWVAQCSKGHMFGLEQSIKIVTIPGKEKFENVVMLECPVCEETIYPTTKNQNGAKLLKISTSQE